MTEQERPGDPEGETGLRETTRGGTRWSAVAAAVVITLAVVTPAFSAGALTGPITKDLEMSTAAFGLALVCFFGFIALGSSLSARLAEHLGAAPQLAMAAGMLMVTLASVSSSVGLAVVCC